MLRLSNAFSTFTEIILIFLLYHANVNNIDWYTNISPNLPSWSKYNLVISTGFSSLGYFALVFMRQTAYNFPFLQWLCWVLISKLCWPHKMRSVHLFSDIASVWLIQFFFKCLVKIHWRSHLQLQGFLDIFWW